ncbi:MAG: nitrous oxide reductase accessory protein NosL [Halobacteriales archaeon]|nr:nitrous oxide reductase accessory protein NosL [Halobacteriales archaeon]
MKSETTRRRFVSLVVGVGVSASMAGCVGGDEELPEPVALSAGQACDVCGMIIQDHPGPVAQTFYRDNRPEGRGEDEPAWFCSLVCMFDFYYERGEQGWEPVVGYVTDYSAVDYEVTQEGATLFVTSHLEAEYFVDSETTTLVVDSDVRGAMGPSLIPFTDSSEATAFQEEYGGDMMEFGDVSRQLVDSL